MRTIKNFKKILFDRKIGFVHLVLNGKIVPFNEPKSFLERKISPPAEFTLLDFAEKTESLVNDKRVKGIFLQVINIEANYADIYELRAILKKWKEKGKKIWIHSPQYTFITYYLASIADKIFLSPGGEVNITGLSLKVKYYTQLFKKHGIKIEVVHVSKFKSALNKYAFEEMPEEEKQMLSWLGESVFETVVEEIAESRGKSKEEVKKMIDSAPITDQEALKDNWIDDILNTEEIAEKAREEMGKKTTFTSYRDAQKKAKLLRKSKKKIAIIPAIGAIVDGKNKEYPFSLPIIGKRQMGDISISEIVRRIRRKKKKYKAVLVFDDSPGGSATASESILNELKQLNSEIPVYFYYHSMAGSGGYYISMSSRRIFSTPLTLTGSIGVINGKPVLKKFYENQGIKPYEFNFGKNASITSETREWTEEEKKKIEKMTFRIYDIFLERVSKHRKKTVDELKKIAGGRVWTGKQALDLGLVDELASFSETISIIAKENKIKHTPSIEVIGAKKQVSPPIGEPKEKTIKDIIKTLLNKTLFLPPYELEIR